MVERAKPLKQYAASSKERLLSLLSAVRENSANSTAQAFHLEQLAWLTIESLNQMALSEKLGFPKGDFGALDLLKESKYLSLEDHRRLKQILEYRNLSKPERAEFKLERETLEYDLVELERIMKHLAST